MRELLTSATRPDLGRRSIVLRVSDMDGRLVAELRIEGEGARRNGRWSLHRASGVQGLLTFTFHDGMSGSVIRAEEVPNAGDYILGFLE
jgi:hypothetical protein